MIAEYADKTRFKVRVGAPAGVVYGLLADSVKWPLYFSPIIHVERLDLDGERERLRMWSLIDGRLESWFSWRRLDPVDRRVEFRQDVSSAAPMESMDGALSVRPRGSHDSTLDLLYAFGVTSDLPDDLAWVEQATTGASRTQLANLKCFAERWTRLEDLVVSFEDSVRIAGPAELVYDFLYRAADWVGRVPNVTGVDLSEYAPGLQRMRMETATEHGPQNTEAVRICFPHAGRIVYKHTTPQPLLEAHTGELTVIPDETGVTVISQHSAVLREEAVAAMLGEHTSLAEARGYVRESLGNMSLALLEQAKTYAESAIRML